MHVTGAIDSVKVMQGQAVEDRNSEARLVGTDDDEAGQPALGSPHDGYAATVLWLALGLIYFSFGALRVLSGSRDGLWWVPLALLPVLLAVGIPAWKYFSRAHGLKQSGGFPAMPALGIYFAFFSLVAFVLPVLVSAMEIWIFALACLILSALTVAPVQLILSKDPNRHSPLTA